LYKEIKIYDQGLIVLKAKIPLSVFGCLKEIADRNGSRYTEWAQKSEIHNTRISEYGKMFNVELGLEEFTENAKKRAFTIETAVQLYSGLKKLIGEALMKKDIVKCIDAEQDPLKRIILMAMVKQEEDDKRFLQMLSDYSALLFKAEMK